MLFEGQTIQVKSIEDGIYDLVFDRQGDSVNKLDQRTLAELRTAVDTLNGVDGLRGVIFRVQKIALSSVLILPNLWVSSQRMTMSWLRVC